jgi:hypothetical protein
MKSVVDELAKIASDLKLDRQHSWMTTYKIDSIRLGRMCEKYPALHHSWEQFKLMYDIARSQDDIDRQST